MPKFHSVVLSSDLEGKPLEELIANSTMNNRFPVFVKTKEGVFLYGSQKNGQKKLTQLDNTIHDIIKFPERLNQAYLRPKDKMDARVFHEARLKNAHLLALSAKYFINPFGVAGDRTAIPNDSQIDGSVSYEDGFPIDYQKNLDTDPNAKAIPRNQFNELMYDATQAIQQYQQQGFFDFITAADNGGVAFPYDKDAVVRYDAGSGVNLYFSLVNNNTALPTDTTKWAMLLSTEPAQVSLSVPYGILATVPTIVPFNTVEFDSSGLFNGTTKFTPKRPGKYCFNALLLTDNLTTSNNIFLYLYKNGFSYKLLDLRPASPSGESQAVGGSTMAIANGTTDFFELAIIFSSSLQDVGYTGSDANYFGIQFAS